MGSNSTRRTSTFVEKSFSRPSLGIPSLSDTHPEAESMFIHADNISPVEDRPTSPFDYAIPEQSLDTQYDPNQLGTPQPRSVRPRPSLTERTMETLARIPSSPALRKKSSSSFYEQQGRPTSRSGSGGSRPGSSYTSDGSAKASAPSSRPLSRDEPEDIGAPKAAGFGYKSALSTIDSTLEGSSGSPMVKRSIPRPLSSTPSKLALRAGTAPARSPSPAKALGRTPVKPTARPTAAKPLVTSARKPAVPAQVSPRKESTDEAASGWDGSIAPLAKPKTRTREPEPKPTAGKSSSALREQIAKARAAAKQTAPSSRQDAFAAGDDAFAPVAQSKNTFDYNDDPFGQKAKQPVGAKVLMQRISAARSSGKLDISALDLSEMPEDVLKIYDIESIGTTGGSWADSVDLTRLSAADNAFEVIDDKFFPDVDMNDFDIDDDVPPNIFCGLETMDLHGNKLCSVPTGFRRLSVLTSLNLSSNKLTNDGLEIISQMAALRDLKLANNELSGTLDASLTALTGLEILDLKGNNLTSLPDGMSDMARLRILNLAENAIESIPVAELATLPLSELILRKNKLSGAFVEGHGTSFPSLQSLDISCNQIRSIGPNLELPMLHTLVMSMNRVQELPDMSSWASLLTLTADENQISVIPESFLGLPKLRQVDFSGNDIRVIPPEVARMDSLAMIRLGGNPLRDKKFATATTDEIKETLAGRLEPPPPYDEASSEKAPQPISDTKEITVQEDDYDSHSDGEDKFATPPTSAQHTPSHSRSNIAPIASRIQRDADQWTVTSAGVLDRSKTDTASLSHSRASSLASSNEVRQVLLHHNLFTAIPTALNDFAATLTTLSLASNQISGEGYLSDTLSLPVLEEFSLASNQISSMQPLADHLDAPNLGKLDLSFNRLTALPEGLKERFPKLSVLLVANNQITELKAAAAHGLRILEISNNDIGALDPQLGLLAGKGGLERLDVSGNRFKVPRWNILEQGTQATLKWLRGRVPQEELAQWKTDNGENSDDDAF